MLKICSISASRGLILKSMPSLSLASSCELSLSATGRSGEAAVRASDDAVGADEADVVHEALRNEARVLDVGRRRVDDPRHHDLSLGRVRC